MKWVDKDESAWRWWVDGEGFDGRWQRDPELRDVIRVGHVGLPEKNGKKQLAHLTKLIIDFTERMAIPFPAKRKFQDSKILFPRVVAGLVSSNREPADKSGQWR